MPRRTCRPYGYNQILLLPSSLREWLPADLDLTPIPTTYGGVTRDTVPSDPRRRLAVLLYAEARAVPASRQIARKLHEDIAFQPWRRIARRISRPSVTSTRSIWTRSGTYSCRRSSSVATHNVLMLWTPRRRRPGAPGLQGVSGMKSGTTEPEKRTIPGRLSVSWL